MKSVSLLVLVTIVALQLGSCATESTPSERMVITPHILTFAPSDSVKSVSITHTCTCPFTWWSSQPASSAEWVTVPASMQGDHSNVQISIDRTKMPGDSAHAWIRITSNAYGIDSIEVTATR